MDLGIKINTEDGIKQADKEIKEWLKTMQSHIDKSKLKIEFELPKGLNEQLKKLETTAKNVGQSIGGSHSKSIKTINVYRDSIEKLERAYGKLNAEQRKGAEGQAIIKSARDLNQSYGEYKGTLKDVLKEEQRHEHQLQKTGKAMQQLRNIAASYLSIYMGIRLTRQMADITGEFEMQRKALAAMLDNAERAEAIFSQIKTLAVVSPFEVKDLVSYTKQLTAFSVPYEELYDTTKRLADISAGLGVDMGRLILAFGQVRAAAVLRGQELRQFTEAGIPLVDELVRKFRELGEETITTADIFDKIYTRQVPFEMVRDIMFEMTEEGGKFFMMQEVQADTLKGKITNLTDAYNIMLSEIGEKGRGVMGGFVDTLKNVMVNHESLTTAIFAFVGALGIAKVAAIALNAKLREQIALQATKALAQGAASAYGAIAAIVGVLAYQFSKWYKEANKVKDISKELIDTSNRLQSSIDTEVEILDISIRRLKEAEKGTKLYSDAKENLIKRYGKYLDTLREELDAVTDLNDIYVKLRRSIEEAGRSRAIDDFIESATSRVVSETGDYWAKIDKRLQNTYGKDPKVARVIVESMKAVVDELDGIGNASRDQWKLSGYYGDRVIQNWTGKIHDLNKELKSSIREAEIRFTKQKTPVDDGDNIQQMTSVNKLLSLRADIQERINKIQGDKRATLISPEDEKALENLQESYSSITERLKKLGYEEAKGLKSTTTDYVKEFLDGLKQEIDIYSKQINIWEGLEKSISEPLYDFIIEKVKEVGVDLSNIDILGSVWGDIIDGVKLTKQEEGFVREMYDRLRDLKMAEHLDNKKRLKELEDTYATFSERIDAINTKFHKDISDMRDAGMSDEKTKVAQREHEKQIEEYALSYAKESEEYSDFLQTIAKYSTEKLIELRDKIEALMTSTGMEAGFENEQYALLAALFEKLKDMIPEPKNTTFEQWRKLHTLLGRINRSFNEIGDSFGGMIGEVMSLGGQLATSTIDIIQSIEYITKGSTEGIEKTATTSAKAMQAVEQASIILAIIAAALKAVKAVIDFIERLINLRANKEIKKQEEAVEKLQKEYKILQHEIKKAFGGDYFKQANLQLENLRKQSEAYEKQLEAEQSKSGKKAKKNSKELEDALLDNKIAQEDLLADMVDKMAGTSLAEAARSFADAWADAYYSFEDTSKAIEDRFKEMARNMVIENIISGRIGEILKPSFDYLEKALDGGMGLTDNEMETWLSMMENAKDAMILESSYWEQIVESMDDLLGRGKGESNLSGISKGIASASEDTVLLVGGYLDSIRFKLFPYIDFMMGEYSSTINVIMTAQIQQVNHLREIEAAAKSTAVSNREIVNTLNSVIEVGDSGRRLRV